MKHLEPFEPTPAHVQHVKNADRAIRVDHRTWRREGIVRWTVRSRAEPFKPTLSQIAWIDNVKNEKCEVRKEHVFFDTTHFDAVIIKASGETFYFVPTFGTYLKEQKT